MSDGDPNENVETPVAEQPRRVWFHLQEVELDWLRISEAAFLLWVLAGLVLAWLIVAVLLLLL